MIFAASPQYILISLPPSSSRSLLSRLQALFPEPFLRHQDFKPISRMKLLGHHSWNLRTQQSPLHCQPTPPLSFAVVSCLSNSTLWLFFCQIHYPSSSVSPWFLLFPYSSLPGSHSVHIHPRFPFPLYVFCTCTTTIHLISFHPVSLFLNTLHKSSRAWTTMIIHLILLSGTGSYKEKEVEKGKQRLIFNTFYSQQRNSLATTMALISEWFESEPDYQVHWIEGIGTTGRAEAKSL